MAPKKTTNTTSMTNAQLKALIAQGVADALAEIEANQSRNGDDSHDSGSVKNGTVGVFVNVKFETCTLQGNALTWWNSHVKTTTPEAAHAMPGKTLKKMMTDKYCPRGKIKKIEFEMWNLKVKGTDVKISTFTERQAENKRKLDNNNQAQQQLPKRQNVAQAYTAGTGERKEYAGTLPLCNKCKFHHNGQCTVKCANCKKVDHLTRDCWNPTTANNQRNLTCYECGNQGDYRNDCPKLKNRNHEN
ncbi:RNA-directed DNA polymerase, eukaryota [Tanacetum coccineum]